MSGEKRTYVSVEQRELRRLREQESRLRSVQRDLPERLQAVRRQAEQEMHDRLRPLEDRQRAYENMLNGLRSELGGLERETRNRLKRQDKELRKRLRDQRGEYLRWMGEQDRKFTSMIEEERRERQRAVDRLQGRIQSIVADARRKDEAARAFVADLSKIVEDVGRLPHERFASGRLDAIARHVEDARRSVEAGMPEASLSTAQQAYWDVADLRALVLLKEREFTLLHQAALEEARTLLEEARSHRRYRLEVGEGRDAASLDLEVDYWTRGELTAHEEEVRKLEKELLDGAEVLSIEEVKGILSRMEALKPRVDEIVERARQSILLSQVRTDIAELAAEGLAREGFVVEDAAYEGDDQRNAYVLKMKNVAGSEVVAVVSPVEGESGKNEVSINSYDQGFVDEDTLYQRATEIASVMRGEGLKATTPEHVGDARPEVRDMGAVRAKKRGDRVTA